MELHPWVEATLQQPPTILWMTARESVDDEIFLWWQSTCYVMDVKKNTYIINTFSIDIHLRLARPDTDPCNARLQGGRANTICHVACVMFQRAMGLIDGPRTIPLPFFVGTTQKKIGQIRRSLNLRSSIL